MCVLAVYNKPLTQRITSREYNIWTIHQGIFRDNFVPVCVCMCVYVYACVCARVNAQVSV